MRRTRWYHYITLNLPWFGLTMVSGSMTPLILPFLVQQFVPAAAKNSFYGDLRFYGLMVALLVQPVAGLLSDRSTSRWGRRRPFILVGALLAALLLGGIGLAAGYWPLFALSLLLQAAANVTHGALQGVIPDLVPHQWRGTASGIKALMEVLPLVVIALTVARLLDTGRLWTALLVIGGALLSAVLVMVATTREEPLPAPPNLPIKESVLRVGALAIAFLLIVRGFRAALLWLGSQVAGDPDVVVLAMGGAGLLATVGAIVLGVWYSVRMGIGPAIRKRPAFTWWVVNRLLFLAAIGIIQGFSLYYVQDVLEAPNAASVTGQLMTMVGLCTVVSAVVSGPLADLLGRKALLAAAGALAALGTVALLASSTLPMVYLSSSVVGLGAGTFMATNWALGTDLVPVAESGRFLGVSNLAGAGAGSVAAGIGGPLADLLNAQRADAGYLAVFGIAAACFLLSILVLPRIPESYKLSVSAK